MTKNKLKKEVANKLVKELKALGNKYLHYDDSSAWDCVQEISKLMAEYICFVEGISDDED